MAENLVVYAGVNMVGKLKMRAVKREAKRQKKSVPELVWDALRHNGSSTFQAELEAAELAKK